MAKSEKKAVASPATTKDALDKAREKFSEVAERARRGGSQVKESAGRASEVAKEKAAQASEAAKEKYGVAVDNIKQGYDRAHKDIGKLTDDVNEYVRDNPGRSVLIAAGVGFAVGILLRGRRS